MSFRQRSFFTSTRNLFLFQYGFFTFSTVKILQSRKVPSEWQGVAEKAPSEWHLRNVIPTEKFFTSTRNLFISRRIFYVFDRKRFFSRWKTPSEWHIRNVIPTIGEISISFRQRSFLLRRGIFFLFQHGFFTFSIGRDSSVAEKLLQNDRESMKSSFRMTMANYHSDREVFYFD